jgi:hypothetical protein
MRFFPPASSLLLLLGSLALPLSSSGAQATGAEAWEIGPVIRGKNYSVGMPLRPTPAREGWYFDFPYPNERAGHAHALTFRHGPLIGKTKIIMHYRIDAAPGVQFIARERPGRTAALTMFFQRRGDNWSAKGPYEAYRWYAPVDTMVPLTPGEHRVTVSLDAPWKAVMKTSAQSNPAAFRDALANTDRVGFVLGSVGGRGHGVFTTGPARMTVLSFEVR